MTMYGNRRPMMKSASVYDQQGISNRGEKELPFSFSALPAHQSEVIIDYMKKEATTLGEMSIDKTAAPLSNPFESFGHARSYISSKLGLTEDSAHELASSVVARAQDLQEIYGGDMNSMMSGIIDQMNPEEVQKRTGAVPMRPMSSNETEEHVKAALMEQMQMSAYQADQFKKIVMQEARNLNTRFRQYTTKQIADAILGVIIEHQDSSVAYGISSSDRLRGEIERQLV